MDEESKDRPVTEMSDRELAEETVTLLRRFVPAFNSLAEPLNWLTENTAGLFEGFKQMQAAGGPMALLGAMSQRKGNDG